MSMKTISRISVGNSRDVAISLALTGLCSLLVYWILGHPMLTGIDDENITQNYGLNLANGFGYVYTPHAERVEGATSPLWVGVNYLLYKVTSHPEPFVLACGVALTALAIYWALGITRCLSVGLALPTWAFWIPVGAIAAQPNYFHWSVVTLMDQGLWSAIVMGLAFVLARQIGSANARPRVSVLGAALCILSVLARPESMLLIPVMLVLAGIALAANTGVRASLRSVAPYFALMLLSLGALTVLRIAYFGYPLPNTYYAKVSSHPKDNILHGLQYLVSFLSSNVLVIPAVLAALLGLALAIRSLWIGAKSAIPQAPIDGMMLLIGGTSLSAIGIAIFEGGDHFPGGRLLQPYLPLMCVALTFYVPLLGSWSQLIPSRRIRLSWTCALFAATLVASYSAFAFAKKDFKEDFTIAQDGRRMGELLNTLPDQPSVGVLPAGGIALTYNGRVADLLGLNWVDMAHATGRRLGLPGHSAFNTDVFWKQPPEIMLPELIDEANPLIEPQMPGHWELSLLHGLPNEQQFRESYQPVKLHLGNGEIFAYASKRFIERHSGDARIEPLPWGRFRPPQPKRGATSVLGAS